MARESLPLSADQVPYWNRVAPEKRFSHPLPADRLPALRHGERLLDLGDLGLQDDECNRERYGQGARRFGPAGIFRLDEGVVLTHLPEPRVRALLSGFELAWLEDFEVVTMNGHAARAFRALAFKPGCLIGKVE